MRIAVPLVSALFALPVTLHAHHSTSLNFSDEIISIEGQIKSVRWVNPHCSFVVSGAPTPPGFQREIGVKAQGSS